MYKMNKLQKEYLKLKSMYDQAVNNEDWDRVEEMEDNSIETEYNLVKWSFHEAIKAGMKKEEADYMLKNSSLEQYQKFVSLALQLKAS